MYLPSVLYLYNGISSTNIDIQSLSSQIREFTGMKTRVREDIISFYLSGLPSEQKEEKLKYIAYKLSKIKVKDVRKGQIFSPPLPVEQEYEKRNLFKGPFGILYDGFKLSKLFYELIPEKEKNFEYLHVILTNQLLGSWDERNLYWHARVGIYGFPSLISTTGIVEAPAKPKEFYFQKRLGVDPAVLKKKFKGKFIDYNDPRMLEVLKGYLIQALFFHIFGESFCEEKRCCLYNAHWQEEVIQAQLESPKFCPKHQQIFLKLTSTNA